MKGVKTPAIAHKNLKALRAKDKLHDCVFFFGDRIV